MAIEYIKDSNQILGINQPHLPSIKKVPFENNSFYCDGTKILETLRPFDDGLIKKFLVAGPTGAVVKSVDGLCLPIYVNSIHRQTSCPSAMVSVSCNKVPRFAYHVLEFMN